MKLLIDTHIWLWMINKPKRLGRRTAKLLANSRNEIFLSPISIWEVILLGRRGHFSKLRDPYPWLGKAMAEFKLIEAPLTDEIALEMGRFELGHDDPADRMLVATARVMGCPLVTDDEKIIESGCVEVVPND